MNDQELIALYNDLLETLLVNASWVVVQIEETIRQGKPIARQVSRRKGGAESVEVIVAPSKFRDDQFAATEELTPRERVMVALHAVERLLIDPTEIERATLETMLRVKVDEMLFADPSAENVASTKPVRFTFIRQTRLIELLGRVMMEAGNVG